jgi:hypothetical protein
MGKHSRHSSRLISFLILATAFAISFEEIMQELSFHKSLLIIPFGIHSSGAIVTQIIKI